MGNILIIFFILYNPTGGSLISFFILYFIHISIGHGYCICAPDSHFCINNDSQHRSYFFILQIFNRMQLVINKLPINELILCIIIQC